MDWPGTYESYTVCCKFEARVKPVQDVSFAVLFDFPRAGLHTVVSEMLRLFPAVYFVHQTFVRTLTCLVDDSKDFKNRR